MKNDEGSLIVMLLSARQGPNDESLVSGEPGRVWSPARKVLDTSIQRP